MLRRVPFLSVLPLRTLEDLSRHAQEVQVEADVSVIVQGDPGDLYYVITAGSADVITDGHFARSLGLGDGFGEIALLRDIPRTATVTTTSATSLIALERGPFIEAITGTAPAHDAVREAVDGHLDGDIQRGAATE